MNNLSPHWLAKRVWPGGFIVAAAVALNMLLRWLARDVITGDFTLYLSPWIGFIKSQGGLPALRYDFSNYAPPYLYLLALAGSLFPNIPDVYLTKLLSIPFDFGCAWLAYKIVRLQRPGGIAAKCAFAAVLLLPTVLGNGAVWGQADATYTLFVLACVYTLCIGRAELAAACFGLALAFKLQAIFFLPALLMVLLRLPWGGARPFDSPTLSHQAMNASDNTRRSPAIRASASPEARSGIEDAQGASPSSLGMILKLAAVPAVLLLAHLPAVYLGRDLGDVLGIYLAQVSTNEPLNMNSPSWYAWIPHEPQHTQIVLGIVAACVVCALLLVVLMRARGAVTPELIARVSTAVLLAVPFFLPRMHERYFFAGEVMAVILAFIAPPLWPIAAAAQIASMVTYGGYIFRFGHLVDLRLVAVLMGFAAIASVITCIRYALRQQAQDVPETDDVQKVGLVRVSHMVASAKVELCGLTLAVILAVFAQPVGALVRTHFDHDLTLATFVDGDATVRMEGVRADACADHVRLIVTWPEVRNLRQPTAVFVHVYDASGRRIAIADADLQDNQLPLENWTQLVMEQRRIPLPELQSPNTANAVHIGLYYRDSGQRLTAMNRDGAPWIEKTAIVRVNYGSCIDELSPRRVEL